MTVCRHCKEKKDLEDAFLVHKKGLEDSPGNWVYRLKIMSVKGEMKHLTRWCECEKIPDEHI